MCIHVEGGVAALSTQALVNPMYAVHAMPRLRAGEPADAVLASLVGPDPGTDQRQFHVIDAAGRIAQHTGPNCVKTPGAMPGPEWMDPRPIGNGGGNSTAELPPAGSAPVAALSPAPE